jgi:hypothetical protein
MDAARQRRSLRCARVRGGLALLRDRLDEWPAHGTGVENSGLQHFAVNMLTDLGGAGTNGLRLTGRLRGHALKPGGYLLTATPRSGLGARGARSAHFQIVR